MRSAPEEQAVLANLGFSRLHRLTYTSPPCYPCRVHRPRSAFPLTEMCLYKTAARPAGHCDHSNGKPDSLSADQFPANAHVRCREHSPAWTSLQAGYPKSGKVDSPDLRLELVAWLLKASVSPVEIPIASHGCNSSQQQIQASHLTLPAGAAASSPCPY